MRCLLLPAALLGVTGCGDKCPEGYSQNDETEQCIADGTGGTGGDDGTDGGDGADGTADGSDGGSDGADGTADGADGGSDGADGGGGDTLPDDALDGRVEIYGVVDGDLEAWTAFSYEGRSDVTGGNLLLVYMASNRDATCADVESYLLGNGDSPAPLFDRNDCNLTLQFFTPDFATYSDDNALLVTNGGEISAFVECAFGPGEWVSSAGGPINGWSWEEGDVTDTGEVPPTLWFQGQAIEGEVTGLESVAGGHEVILEPDAYRGVFPYSDEFGSADARGTGKGVIRSELCPGLEATRYFTAPPDD